MMPHRFFTGLQVLKRAGRIDHLTRGKIPDGAAPEGERLKA